jgi:hypothetical protein
MKGRRLPIGEWPKQPGDYMGPIYGYSGDRPAVFFLLPIARDAGVPASARVTHHVVSPPHTFRECQDGSLEIRASIGAKDWHGYLDEGHQWRL